MHAQAEQEAGNKAKAEIEKSVKAKLEKEFEQKLQQSETALKQKLSHQLEGEYAEKAALQ